MAVIIEGGKRHDVQVTRTSRFELGTILVMNRGYVDFRPPDFDSSRSVLRDLIWTHEPSPSNLP